MDFQSNLNYSCPNHPDFRIEYIQVSGLNYNKPNQSLLYCLECIENDPNYNKFNYVLLQKIIKSSQDEINLQWPPLKDEQILNKLKVSLDYNNNQIPIENVIESFFSQFKIEVIKQIDMTQKIMIEKALEISFDKPNILQKYQELSKIQELKNIFNNNKTSTNEKQNKYQELINNIDQLSENITSQFNQIINSQQIKTIFNIEPFLQVKDTILNEIKNINFFPNISKKQLNKNNLITTFIQRDDYSGLILNDGQNIIKNSNDEFIIQYQGDHHFYIVLSDYILDRNNNYIFKLKLIPNQQDDQCGIYLAYQLHQLSYATQIGCNFKHSNNEMFISLNKESFKQIKGNEFKLAQEQEIEIRINLNDEIYQIIDLPNRNNILQQEQLKEYFKENNQRLYFQIFNQSQMKIILQEGYIVDSFQ